VTNRKTQFEKLDARERAVERRAARRIAARERRAARAQRVMVCPFGVGDILQVDGGAFFEVVKVLLDGRGEHHVMLRKLVTDGSGRPLLGLYSEAPTRRRVSKDGVQLEGGRWARRIRQEVVRC
jgi:hypothetical protein